MATPPADVIKNLSRLGSQIQKYQQAEAKQGGFCTGVCIDWARRVLLGGKPAFTTDEERLKFQFARQIRTQKFVSSKEKLGAEVVEVIKALMAADEDARKKGEAKTQISRELRDRLLKCMETKYMEVGPPQPDEKYDRALVKKWVDALVVIMDTCDHRTEVGWQALVEAMDKVHVRTRELQSRNVSTRPFSYIKIIASSEAIQYSSIDDALQKLLVLAEFVNNTVLLLDFRFDGSIQNEDGHAVAIHRLESGRFHFIDPNYGVYDYDKNGLASAVLYLFGPKGGGTPIYGEEKGVKVNNQVAYIVFGRA